jgi:hypothetical protein
MIYIDFQAGAHGNYLDFVCNKFLAGVACNDTPFNQQGASHAKLYYGEKQFNCWHYSDFHGTRTEITNSKIISIQITTDDLLPLQSISLLRAGDRNIDNDRLEINTYHKLDNPDYKWVLDNLIASFFKTQLQDSYNAVKDVSWPDINCMADFEGLPEWIKSECLDKHNLRLLQLGPEHADCPRHVLGEFFKIGFKKPEQSGFITQQEKMIYDSSNDVKVFTFGSFYNTDQFVQQLQGLAQWSGYQFKEEAKIRSLHELFLSKQPYQNSKKFCDQLIDQICQGQYFELPKLDLMKESYILAQLENRWNCEFPADSETWFANSRQLLDFRVS